MNLDWRYLEMGRGESAERRCPFNGLGSAFQCEGRPPDTKDCEAILLD